MRRTIALGLNLRSFSSERPHGYHVDGFAHFLILTAVFCIFFLLKHQSFRTRHQSWSHLGHLFACENFHLFHDPYQERVIMDYLNLPYSPLFSISPSPRLPSLRSFSHQSIYIPIRNRWLPWYYHDYHHLCFFFLLFPLRLVYRMVSSIDIKIIISSSRDLTN